MFLWAWDVCDAQLRSPAIAQSIDDMRKLADKE